MATLGAWLGSICIWLLLTLTAVPIFCLIFIYRFLLGKLVPFFNAKVAGLVDRRSSLYLRKDANKNVRRAFMFLLEGKVELSQLRSRVICHVVEKRLANNELLRPELQQFPVAIGGYYFWQWEEGFNIKNHINLLQVEPSWPFKEKSGQSVLEMVEEKVLGKSFQPNKSPWELFILHNYRDSPDFGQKESSYTGTMIILHISHVLGDGSTIRGLCEDMIGDRILSESPKVKDVNEEHNKFGFKSQVATMFFGPWNTLQLLQNERKLTDNRVAKAVPPATTQKCTLGMTPNIPVQLLERIQKSQEVTFTAVITALVGRAYRKLVVSAGQEPPELIVCYCTSEMPRETSIAMRNNVYLLTFTPYMTRQARLGTRSFLQWNHDMI